MKKKDKSRRCRNISISVRRKRFFKFLGIGRSFPSYKKCPSILLETKKEVKQKYEIYFILSRMDDLFALVVRFYLFFKEIEHRYRFLFLFFFKENMSLL